MREELRPLVFEEVRLQVDEEMRVLLQNLKVSNKSSAPVMSRQSCECILSLFWKT